MRRHFIVGKACGGESNEFMPRQARHDAPGALHHVMILGIEGTPIFRNGEEGADGERWLDPGR
jgi:hypothetical protein